MIRLLGNCTGSATVLAAVVLFSTVSTAPANQGVTRDQLARLLTEMPYLDVGAVLYNRSARLMSIARPVEEPAFQNVLAQLRDAHFAKGELLTLLEDPSPHIRTLAAVALFEREDPSVLPALASLASDASSTFDTPGPVDPFGRRLGPQKQTVGDIATALVTFYMRQAGYHYGIQRQFHYYWAARSNRLYCTSWFAVRLARASQGTTPLPPTSLGEVRKLRKQIDALPGDDRFWILLGLGRGEFGGAKSLVTDSELIECCKRLGPDKLLQALQRKIPSLDPDLQPTMNDHVNYWLVTNRRHHEICSFILQHAKELLRPGDTKSLRACQRWERDNRRHEVTNPIESRLWSAAISALQPASSPRASAR